MSRCLALVVAVLLLTAAPAAAERTRPPLGRLIVRGFEKAWIVPARGRIVPLARAASLDWSPALRLLAVTANGRLSLRTADGRTLRARDHAELVSAPRWSSGAPVRLAFLAGRSLRVADARDLREQRFGRAADVAPAWRPGRDEIAFVRPGGEVVLLSGTGRLLARWHPPRMPVGLSWTGDARHLIVSSRYSVIVVSARLAPESTQRSSAILSVAAAPAGSLFGVLTVRERAGGAQVTTLEVRDAERPGQRTPVARAGVLTGRIVWSPDAHTLLVQRPLQKDWLLVDVRTRRVRDLAWPRGIRPIFDGVAGWFG